MTPMKHTAFLLVLMMAAFAATAQLKVKADCGVLTVDVHKGWINEAKPNIDPEQIKIKLPCFTSFEKEDWKINKDKMNKRKDKK